MKEIQFKELRQRAEIFLKKYGVKSKLKETDLSKLIDKVILYQVELEIQNEDLLKSQAELIESNSKYIELYDLAPVAYFAIDKDALIKEVNQAGCELLGLKKQGLINRCFSRYITSECQSVFSQYKKEAFQNPAVQSFELTLSKWNQPSFYASLHCKVIGNSSYKQMLMFVTDITNQKNTEIMLHQHRIKMSAIDRLRSLNEFIYGISEEQNNSITIINNYIQGCIIRLENKKYKVNEILEILKKTSIESGSLTDIIRKRKNSTSKSIFRYEIVNINTVIYQTISLLRHEIEKYHIMILYESTPSNMIIKADIFHIQQAMLNIMRNAIEAMRDASIKESKLLIEIMQKENDNIEVIISDNGPGIHSEVLKKLFEPHFTTKSYGIGLGLSVSKAIIEKHGGNLIAAVNPDGGACFSFTLPCVQRIPAQNSQV